MRIKPGTTPTPPDRFGVYEATVQARDPNNPNRWLTKTSNQSVNTMFPASWDEARIVAEVDAAWNSPAKVVNGDVWRSTTPSGVRVRGYTTPRTTVFPLYRP
ncbi:EndoU domain-containing protein [Pseudomonas glycinae]|uniref:EndoU domain-containing protein n=1 Tax=Pseudomonas glycinae TaxID=1785145 RepID=UPI0018D79BD5|nr:EndoU domain-containing protein [Pseudomonas glycinae]